MMSPKLQLEVYTSSMRELANGGQFSPTTATILSGPSEALLIDTGYMESDVAEVSRRIEASGRTLTAICVTHAHADHYFGLERLLKRFPAARAVAAPSVVSQIIAGNEAAREQWRVTFSGAALDNTAIPEPLARGSLTVDGEDVRIIEVGQGDVPHNTVVHIPSIHAVVCGDVIYHGINPFLAASGPDEWPSWIDSVDKVAALAPRIVVAGHKRAELPDDDVAGSIDGTRSYIREFMAGVEQCGDSRELVAYMQARFPDYGNPSALILSAVTAFRRKKQTAP